MTPGELGAPEPLTDVRDVSRIAYGFMASKALFAALELDVFSRLAAGPRTLEDLARETGTVPTRLLKLLTACVSLGLLDKAGASYANAPACQTYLVRDAPAYFGDYYRLQVDRQIYPLLEQLHGALRGERPSFYGRTMEDPEQAELFSRAQHAGSLGPAAVAAKLVDLDGCRTLLDVGGGSGAFSLTLCRRNPDLSATILDFPRVRPLAERFIQEAALGTRVRFLPGDALASPWPDGQDAILMSYLLSAVSETSARALLDRAFDHLGPGGLFLLHDFVVGDDQAGPAAAALWLLSSVCIDPDSASLTPGWLSARLAELGFTGISVRNVIPGLTRLLVARKPPGPAR